MTFVPVPGKINCTHAKVYCPISLLLMQKTMQKLVARNMKEEYQGRNSGICPLHLKQSAYKPCGYAYTDNSGKQVVTLSFPRY